MMHRLDGRVEWADGPVGDAVRLSERERLRRFIRDEESETVALFTAKGREVSDAGEWYGEHLGKWLVAVGYAWRRTQDPELAATIRRVVDFVVAQQEVDGYLGTYREGAACRFNSPGAEDVRTWDLWVHAWTLLGLLEVGCESEPLSPPGERGRGEGRSLLDFGLPFSDSREEPEIKAPLTPDPSPPEGRGEPGVSERALAAAIRIGELLLAAFPAIHRSVLDLGNHAGLSSSILIEPLAELSLATGDPRYARLALDTVDELEKRLGFLSKNDVAEIGTGKAYQLCWNLSGLVALYRATGDERLLETAERLWANIAEEHLTPLGGPWGGVAGHKEVFNAKGFFSPYGMVETCSAASWMSLSRELFRVTGNVRYVEAFERTLMNTFLGALDKNGRDWCYFTFPNGRRSNTYHWACCKSSGAMALEQCAAMVATTTDAGTWVNLLLPCRVEIEGRTVEIEESGEGFILTFDGPLFVRIPEWAFLRSATLDGQAISTNFESGYLKVDPDDAEGREVGMRDAEGPSASLIPTSLPSASSEKPNRLALNLERPIRVVPKTYTVDHHGQEVVRMDYAYLARGPYVYATGLIDGYRKEETLRLARLIPEAPFRPRGEEIDLHLPGRDAIPFAPYFRAGGRHEGAWRTTWLQIAWQ